MSDFWIDIDEHWETLKDLIKKFHPNYVEPITSQNAVDKIDLEKRLPITSQMAEERRKAIVPALTVTKNPIEEAEEARADRNKNKMYLILQEVWMGAPESRAVYRVPGFNLLCSILEGE